MRISPAVLCLVAASMGQLAAANEYLNFDDSSFQDPASPDQQEGAAVFSTTSSFGLTKAFNWTTNQPLFISAVTLYSKANSITTTVRVWTNLQEGLSSSSSSGSGGTADGGTGSSGTGSSGTGSSGTDSSGTGGNSGSGVTLLITPTHTCIDCSSPTSVAVQLRGPGGLMPRSSLFNPTSRSSVGLDGFADSNTGDGTVTVTNIRGDSTVLDQAMYFVANWTSQSDKSITGASASRAFTFTNAEPNCIGGDTTFCDLEKSYNNPSPAIEEQVSPASGTTGAANSSGTGTAVASAINHTPASAATAATNPGAMPSSSSGLSTGAIVGIAVGCAFVALVLLAILACWLLRRRRGQSAMRAEPEPYGVVRTRTDELIAEKEANSGVAEATPHSPYSDDGMPGEPSNGYVAARGIRRKPVSAAAPQAGSSSEAAAAATAAAPAAAEDQRHSLARSLTPQPVSNRYAHLVEEGMTEDDIRRLEEEERHLDAAIEQAGRRS